MGLTLLPGSPSSKRDGKLEFVESNTGGQDLHCTQYPGASPWTLQRWGVGVGGAGRLAPLISF